MKNFKLLFVFAVLNCFSSIAQVSIASIFSDNMVLQRNVNIPVWGSAKANEKVEITFHNQKKTAKADKAGKWNIQLDKESAGGPYVLIVKGKNTIEIKNVLVGEVWILSGQSNMEWTVGQSDNASSEIAKANYPNIRHIKVPKEINLKPNQTLNNVKWSVCSPKTVSDFSGIGYFYAKQLQDKLHIPIGIINASWGGTNIETWISKEGFESNGNPNDSVQAKYFKEIISQMPKDNLNTLLDLKMVANQNRIEKLQKSKLTTENVPFYKELNYNDASWLELQQPGNWEEQSLGDFDGVVWLRKHFILNKEDLNAINTIEFPAIDDNDETYINGIKIGETSGWDIKRSYQFLSKILKVGDNVIAVRVIDNSGGGGIHGKKEVLKLKLGTKEIPLNGTWKFQVEAIKNTINENEFPSLCYNAMINPLIPFAFKGVLWYQGESNAMRAYQYNKTFPLLINDWRTKWNTNFPFYFVQLATYKTQGNSNEGCPWAELREAQTNTLQVQNTAMVVTTDIGDPNDIHPTNKQEVGRRLASVALNNLYNQKMICGGPTFVSFKNNQNKTTIVFDSKGSGLKTSNNNAFISGFEVAGDNQVFYPAVAFLKDDKVILTCEKVLNPIAIRFGWIGDASNCNLINKEGYPAVPFRTDNWKLSTEGVLYEIQKLSYTGSVLK